MARRTYDPLDFVPSPEVVRQKLADALTLAERLRVLLELAERLDLPLATASDLISPTPSRPKGGISGVSVAPKKDADGTEGGRRHG